MGEPEDPQFICRYYFEFAECSRMQQKFSQAVKFYEMALNYPESEQFKQLIKKRQSELLK